jgi:hypothetical protein
MNSRSIRKCMECDEEKFDGSTICNICGSSITTITNPSLPSGRQEQDLEGLRNSFRDIFGDDIVAALDGVLGTMAPSRKVSIDYFQRLAKVVVDRNKSIINDSYLEINHLKILTTTSSFYIPSLNSKYSGEIVPAEPAYGESSLIGDYEGKIVVMKRGKVSFVRKAIEAQSKGAIALVVRQDTEKWPFVMTDSANEQASLGQVCIPIMMISTDDGLLLDNLFSSIQRRAVSVARSESMLATIHLDGQQTECIVCRDEYLEDDVVIKLPCRHLYHHDCLKAWLERNNTCPMCRHAMPS